MAKVRFASYRNHGGVPALIRTGNTMQAADCVGPRVLVDLKNHCYTTSMRYPLKYSWKPYTSASDFDPRKLLPPYDGHYDFKKKK